MLCEYSINIILICYFDDYKFKKTYWLLLTKVDEGWEFLLGHIVQNCIYVFLFPASNKFVSTIDFCSVIHKTFTLNLNINRQWNTNWDCKKWKTRATPLNKHTKRSHQHSVMSRPTWMYRRRLLVLRAKGVSAFFPHSSDAVSRPRETIIPTFQGVDAWCQMRD